MIIPVQTTDLEYKEVTGRRLNNFSQLQKFNILNDNDDHLYNIFINYEINTSVKDNDDYISYYDVDYNDWWENIAFQYYQNENLWWMVALTNDVVNPFEELNEGDSIKLIDRRWTYNIVKEVKALSG